MSRSHKPEARAGATNFVVLDEDVRLCFISPALLRQLNPEADLLTLEPHSIPKALGIQCDLEKSDQLLHALYQENNSQPSLIILTEIKLARRP